MSSLSLMIKPAGGKCNLACQYCFYCDVIETRESSKKASENGSDSKIKESEENLNYVNKSEQKSSKNVDFKTGEKAAIGESEIMTKETAKKLIIDALNYAEGDEIYFAFQGGEPLFAGLEYFNFFVDTVKENNKYESRIFYNIQTNGTLINRDWATFFRENEFLVGLSLDGNRKTNVYRKTKNLKESFDIVYEKVKLLKEEKVEFNILVVLTDLIADNIKEVYGFLKEEGLTFLQFIPCLNPFIKDENKKFLTKQGMEKFLSEAFTLYANDFLKDEYVSIRQFDNWVRMYLNEPPEQCGLMGYCYRQVVSENNGDIYPCDFFCVEEWHLGNIHKASLKSLMENSTAKSFIRESVEVSKTCAECPYYKICRQGGCKRLRMSDDFCSVYKEFFKKAEPLFNAIRLKLKRY